jgi:hypothetical protein
VKVHVEVTDELIKLHGASVDDPYCCPGWHALKAAGVDVDSVVEAGFFMTQARWVAFPLEFYEWQNAAIESGGMKPISFEVEVEETPTDG